MIELNPITGPVFGGEHDVCERGLAGTVHVDGHRRPGFQWGRCSNKSSVQIYRYGLACIGKAFAVHLDEHVGLNSGAAATARHSVAAVCVLTQLHSCSSLG